MPCSHVTIFAVCITYYVMMTMARYRYIVAMVVAKKLKSQKSLPSGVAPLTPYSLKFFYSSVFYYKRLFAHSVF